MGTIQAPRRTQAPAAAPQAVQHGATVLALVCRAGIMRIMGMACSSWLPSAWVWAGAAGRRVGWAADERERWGNQVPERRRWRCWRQGAPGAISRVHLVGMPRLQPARGSPSALTRRGRLAVLGPRFSRRLLRAAAGWHCKERSGATQCGWLAGQKGHRRSSGSAAPVAAAQVAQIDVWWCSRGASDCCWINIHCIRHVEIGKARSIGLGHHRLGSRRRRGLTVAARPRRSPDQNAGAGELPAPETLAGIPSSAATAQLCGAQTRAERTRPARCRGLVGVNGRRRRWCPPAPVAPSITLRTTPPAPHRAPRPQQASPVEQ